MWFHALPIFLAALGLGPVASRTRRCRVDSKVSIFTDPTSCGLFFFEKIFEPETSWVVVWGYIVVVFAQKRPDNNSTLLSAQNEDRYIIFSEIPSRLDITPPTPSPSPQENTLSPIIMEVENHPKWTENILKGSIFHWTMITGGRVKNSTPCWRYWPWIRHFPKLLGFLKDFFFECLIFDTRGSSELNNWGSVRVLCQLCVWMCLCVCVFFPPAVFGGSIRDSLHFRSLNFWRGGFYNYKKSAKPYFSPWN